jgi:hypothetical protein
MILKYSTREILCMQYERDSIYSVYIGENQILIFSNIPPIDSHVFYKFQKIKLT